MGNRKYKPLNMNILKSKKSTIVSSKTALKDIVPIELSSDVISGKKRIIVTEYNN